VCFSPDHSDSSSALVGRMCARSVKVHPLMGTAEYPSGRELRTKGPTKLVGPFHVVIAIGLPARLPTPLFRPARPRNRRIGRSRYSSRWRKGWDLNPRTAFTVGGFQDRCHQPLGHPSAYRLLYVTLPQARGLPVDQLRRGSSRRNVPRTPRGATSERLGDVSHRVR
jgi:hypothetical protein